MGGNIDAKKYTIKDDGTIVRGKKCPKCGKESCSEGTYCEYCGAKLGGNTPAEHTSNNWREWLLLVLIFAGIPFGVIYLSENNNNNYECAEEVIDSSDIEQTEIWPEYLDNPEEQVYAEHSAALEEAWAETWEAEVMDTTAVECYDTNAVEDYW